MKRIAVIDGAALLTASGALYAGPAEDLLESLDSDLDGQISLEEAAVDPGLGANFQALDADQDGYLTAEELEPFLQPEPEPAPG
jgi:Ca2+-binding EF-hand superfamily protein